MLARRLQRLHNFDLAFAQCLVARWVIMLPEHLPQNMSSLSVAFY